MHHNCCSFTLVAAVAVSISLIIILIIVIIRIWSGWRRMWSIVVIIVDDWTWGYWVSRVVQKSSIIVVIMTISIVLIIIVTIIVVHATRRWWWHGWFGIRRIAWSRDVVWLIAVVSRPFILIMCWIVVVRLIGIMVWRYACCCRRRCRKWTIGSITD